MAGDDPREGGRPALLSRESPPGAVQLSETARELLDWTPSIDRFPDAGDAPDDRLALAPAMQEPGGATGGDPQSPLLRPAARTPSADPRLPDGFIAARASFGRGSAPEPRSAGPGSVPGGGAAPTPPGSAAVPEPGREPRPAHIDIAHEPGGVASAAGLDEAAAYAAYRHRSEVAAGGGINLRRRTRPYPLYDTGDDGAQPIVTVAADESAGHMYWNGSTGTEEPVESGDLDQDEWEDSDAAPADDVSEAVWEVGDDASATRSAVTWTAPATPLTRQWGAAGEPADEADEADEDAEEDEPDEEDEDDYESSQRPDSSPLEDPRRRGFYYPSSEDDGDRRRQRERERSSSVLKGRAVVRGTVVLTLVIVLFSGMTLLIGAAVIVRQNQQQAGEPGAPSKGASGAPDTRCNNKSTSVPPPGAKGGKSGEGNGGDGTGSSGGKAGTGMPPGYLPEPGKVPGELPLPIGDGEPPLPIGYGELPVPIGAGGLILAASCVTHNKGSTGGGGTTSGGTGGVAGTISKVTPDCTANTSSPTSGRGGVQTDAIVRSNRTTAVVAGAQTTETAGAPGLLTTGQEIFGAQLAADTCLNPQVVLAWMLLEESSTAAQGRQAGNDNGSVNVDNNWLNIAMSKNGYRGSATTIWADPITAANATAGWIAGDNTVPGWSPGLSTGQILTAAAERPSAKKTAAQIVLDQIRGIQASGWVSGNPSIESYSTQSFRQLYADVSGVNLPAATAQASPTTAGSGLTPADLTSALATVTPHEIAQLTGQDLVNAVPALEAALTGSAVRTTALTVPVGSGPVAAQRMLAAARAVIGSQYNQGNHDAVSDAPATIMQLGTDCSGFVSYLMGPNGAGLWTQSYATNQMSQAPNLEVGTGTAGHYVTIYNNPDPGDSGHVFIDIEGQWFEDAGGGLGAHQMDAAGVQRYLDQRTLAGTPVYSEIFHPAGM